MERKHVFKPLEWPYGRPRKISRRQQTAATAIDSTGSSDQEYRTDVKLLRQLEERVTSLQELTEN